LGGTPFIVVGSGCYLLYKYTATAGETADLVGGTAGVVQSDAISCAVVSTDAVITPMTFEGGYVHMRYGPTTWSGEVGKSTASFYDDVYQWDGTRFTMLESSMVEEVIGS
jgi:hypothetical protein